jgi:hypothetical protein
VFRGTLTLFLRVKAGAIDLVGHSDGIGLANAGAESGGQPAFEHLG